MSKGIYRHKLKRWHRSKSDNYKLILQRNRAWHREHAAELLAYKRERFRQHPELRARHNQKKRAWYKRNRERVRLQQRQYRKHLPKEVRYRRGVQALLRHKYGMTIIQYEALNRAQKGRCAVCGRWPDRGRKRLDVDHNHKTNKTRGLLCSPCNIFLHHLETYPERIPKLRAYLKRYL